MRISNVDLAWRHPAVFFSKDASVAWLLIAPKPRQDKAKNTTEEKNLNASIAKQTVYR